MCCYTFVIVNCLDLIRQLFVELSFWKIRIKHMQQNRIEYNTIQHNTMK